MGLELCGCEDAHFFFTANAPRQRLGYMVVIDIGFLGIIEVPIGTQEPIVPIKNKEYLELWEYYHILIGT